MSKQTHSETKSKPKEISVIIPTYNRRVLVQEAIDSVLCQTYQDYEIIVIDDGSSDGTSEALQRRYGDQITCLVQENCGESVARNRGIQCSSGKYIALLDSDDRWLPHKLEVQISFANADSNIGIVCSQAWPIDAHGSRLKTLPLGNAYSTEDFKFSSLCISNKVINSTALFKKQAFENAGGYDARIKYGEDWDLWLRISRQYRIKFIPHVLALVRIHQDCQSQIGWRYDQKLLADHIYLLEKCFDQCEPSAAISRLREQAIAKQYVTAYLAAMASGCIDLANEALCLALHHSPITELEPQFTNEIVQHAGLFVSISKVPAYDKSMGFVENALAELQQEEVISSHSVKKIMTEVNIMFGYVAWRQHNFDSALKFYLRAIKINPEILFMRRVITMIIKSTFNISPKSVGSMA